MNKKIILLSLAAVLIVPLAVSWNLASAKDQPLGQPFQAIWDAIADLRTKIMNIQLIPGPQGPAGPVGPQGQKGDKGEDGQNTQHGAGNIAFIYDIYLLGTDGRVWIAYSGNIPYSQITGPRGTMPIPVSAIASWQHISLLDKNGDYWFYTGNANGWQNFGPLP